MRKIKPYFCRECGKSYTQNESISDGYKFYCTDCAKGVLAMDGIPLILIGIILTIAGVMLYQFQPIFFKSQKWVFIIACTGFFAIGILKLIQKRMLRKKHSKQIKDDPPRSELKEKMNQYLNAEKSAQSAPDQKDSFPEQSDQK